MKWIKAELNERMVKEIKSQAFRFSQKLRNMIYDKGTEVIAEIKRINAYDTKDFTDVEENEIYSLFKNEVYSNIERK